MIREMFKTSTPLTKLFVLGFLLILCFFLSFPGIQLGVSFLGYDPGVLQNLTTNSITDHLNLFRLLQIIQSIFIFILPPLIFALLVSDNSLDYLSLNKGPRGQWVWGAFVLIIIAIPAINLIAELNSKILFPDSFQSVLDWMKTKEKESEILTENYLGVKPLSGLFFNLFMIALLPAIGEELLFRGVLQRLFADLFKNQHAGIWFTALLFTAAHFQFLSMVPRLLLGVLFGYMLLWSHTLWLPIIAHFINNAIAVIFYWLSFNSITGKELDEIGTIDKSIVPAMISIVLVTLWMIWFYRDSRKSLKSV